jgi:hypothetical protein
MGLLASLVVNGETRRTYRNTRKTVIVIEIVRPWHFANSFARCQIIGGFLLAILVEVN